MCDLNTSVFHVVFAVVFIDHNRSIVLSPTESIMKNYTRTNIYVMFKKTEVIRKKEIAVRNEYRPRRVI